jgi:hypothetical protein
VAVASDAHTRVAGTQSFDGYNSPGVIA